jgi:hypothetical protein
MDCCNSLPCVPDQNGVLRCLPPNDGGPTCVPVGGTCTINGDCCPGSECIREPGSTQGICGTSTPPGTGGSPGTGGAGGQGTGGTPPCSEYGQICSTRADCCNNVPCTLGMCVIPPA